jgi:hypothetical protein
VVAAEINETNSKKEYNFPKDGKIIHFLF